MLITRNANPAPVDELVYDGLFNVTQAGTVWADARDWRGRRISIRVFSDGSNLSPATSAPWADSIPYGGLEEHVIGHAATADTAWPFGITTAIVEVRVKGYTGALQVGFSSVSQPAWVRVIVTASRRKTAPDHTV